VVNPRSFRVKLKFRQIQASCRHPLRAVNRLCQLPAILGVEAPRVDLRRSRVLPSSALLEGGQAGSLELASGGTDLEAGLRALVMIAAPVLAMADEIIVAPVAKFPRSSVPVEGIWVSIEETMQ
jgi:hypothetical protein